MMSPYILSSHYLVTPAQITNRSRSAMCTTQDRNESSVQKEFVEVGGVRTAVLKLGHFKDSPEKGQRLMILVIPGNPGVPHFYEDFMQELYHQGEGQVPVWAIGHAGHLRPPGETLSISDVYSTQEDVYGLEAQISHKVRFINENIPPDVSLILIGHSIGCYIILNMLNHLTANQVLHCFLLFPTIERMAVSPNGQMMTPVLRHFRWLVVMAALFFSIMPRSCRLRLIQWWFRRVNYPNCIQEAVLETLSPWTANYMTYLGKLEMNKVTELPKSLLHKHFNKLSFYYGACDHWTPKQYYYDLIKEFPKADVRLCDLNMKHAFILETREGRDMAKIVWLWAQSRCPSVMSCMRIDSSEKTWEFND